MIKAKYFLLDVFTNERFRGNSLAIFPQAHSIPEEIMPLISKELNLSESVFLFPNRADKRSIDMRIFTPGRELPTAGHPTIGSAFLVARELDFKPGSSFTLIFNQKIGPVSVDIETGGTTIDRATMYQHAATFNSELSENRETVAALVGLNANELSEDMHPQVVSAGVPFLLVPVKNKQAIRNLQLNLPIYSECETKFSFSGVFPFAVDSEKEIFKIRARMFAPSLGIPEDPATGSACGPLGCYLYKNNKISADQTFLVEQGVEMGRNSQIFVTVLVNKDKEITNVKVGGSALLIGQGELYL